MSLHVCADCGTAYLAAPQCPHCGGGVYRFSWEEDVPKITSGGTTHYHAENPYPAEDVPKPKPKPAKKTSATADEEAAPDAEAN